jgi:hypothetical protein
MKLDLYYCVFIYMLLLLYIFRPSYVQENFVVVCDVTEVKTSTCKYTHSLTDNL